MAKTKKPTTLAEVEAISNEICSRAPKNYLAEIGYDPTLSNWFTEFDRAHSMSPDDIWRNKVASVVATAESGMLRIKTKHARFVIGKDYSNCGLCAVHCAGIEGGAQDFRDDFFGKLTDDDMRRINYDRTHSLISKARHHVAMCEIIELLSTGRIPYSADDKGYITQFTQKSIIQMTDRAWGTQCGDLYLMLKKYLPEQLIEMPELPVNINSNNNIKLFAFLPFVGSVHDTPLTNDTATGRLAEWLA